MRPLAALLCLLPSLCLAIDVVVLPVGETAPWRAVTKPPDGIHSRPIQVCIIPEDADPQDPASRLGCVPVDGFNAPAEGEIPAPMGSGDRVYRAIAIDAGGLVSPATPDTVTVIDLPLYKFCKTVNLLCIVLMRRALAGEDFRLNE